MHAVPFLPPNDVHLVKANFSEISFHWSDVSTSCPGIHYRIVASNCGQCPEVTSKSLVICNGNYSHLINGLQCSFAVQTIICGDIVGDASVPVDVTMDGVKQLYKTENGSFSDAECVQGLCTCLYSYA